MVVATDPYRILQKHLDDMPVGYPATESGVEIELLEGCLGMDDHLLTVRRANEAQQH